MTWEAKRRGQMTCYDARGVCRGIVKRGRRYFRAETEYGVKGRFDRLDEAMHWVEVEWISKLVEGRMMPPEKVNP